MNQKLATFFVIVFLINGCDEDSSPQNTGFVDNPNFETPDWTTASHGKSAEPNFEIVFPSEIVNRIDMVISKENWQKMLDDMTEKYGPFGSGNFGPDGNQNAENPIWAPCEFYFNEKQWYKVGIRFKGNSTLRYAWSRGKWKIPLKLDFDEFEDEYPQIDNQRFYGFKQLSMSSNAMDNSLLREKVTADIFRNAGIPAAHTAFYVVYIDHGEGAQFFGLYTAVEEVDDTVIETQFINDDGNLYKPEGKGATFSKGSFSKESFTKKTNEDDLDWSDILALFDALHDEVRSADSTQWRTQLDISFSTEIFLKWLATNTTIQNWDSYGMMSQNYYLYYDPATLKLTWIPWDHNEALMNGHDNRGRVLSIGLTEVGDDWPLIRFLMDDDVYKDQYRLHLHAVVDGPFKVENMVTIYQKYHDLIRPFIAGTGEDNTDPEISSFTLDQGLNELIYHVKTRNDVVEKYLNSEE